MSFILDTKRLVLQPFKMDDAIQISNLANNKALASILGLPSPYELKDAEDWIAIHPELISEGVEYPLTITMKESTQIIGTITIRIDKNNHKGELGYWIGQEYWGNGFATEAIKCLLAFGFDQLNLNKIGASVISQNIASKTVLKKVGLLKEGTLRQNRLLQKEYVDVEMYGILKTEYK